MIGVLLFKKQNGLDSLALHFKTAFRLVHCDVPARYHRRVVACCYEISRPVWNPLQKIDGVSFGFPSANYTRSTINPLKTDQSHGPILKDCDQVVFIWIPFELSCCTPCLHTRLVDFFSRKADILQHVLVPYRFFFVSPDGLFFFASLSSVDLILVQSSLV